MDWDVPNLRDISNGPGDLPREMPVTPYRGYDEHDPGFDKPEPTSSATSPDLKDLEVETKSTKEHILDIIQQTPGPTDIQFFPQLTFDKLISENLVAAELTGRFGHALDVQTIRKFTNIICGHQSSSNKTHEKFTFKKIFALLILVDKLPYIDMFISEGVADIDLPFQKIPHQDEPSIFDLGLASGTGQYTSTELSRCFHSWSPSAIQMFERWQWTMLAPVFRQLSDGSVRHFVFQNQIPLPFTLDSRKRSEEAASVFTVRIHPEHDTFHTPFVRSQKNSYTTRAPDTESSQVTGQLYTIKRSHSRGGIGFRREVQILRRFHHSSHHKHLISLLITYEQLGRFYLVFPSADASLHSYWRDINQKPAFNQETIAWVAEQCRGLTAAIAQIHFPRFDRSFTREEMQLFWRHGNINPQNVMWFESKDSRNGTLKLANDGAYESRDATIQLEGSLKTSRRFPTTYQPPEYELGETMDRSGDIWSLGCIYLEFVTWLLGGWDLLDLFIERRSATHPVFREARTPIFYEFVEDNTNLFTVTRVKKVVKQVTRNAAPNI